MIHDKDYGGVFRYFINLRGVLPVYYDFVQLVKKEICYPVTYFIIRQKIEERHDFIDIIFYKVVNILDIDVIFTGMREDRVWISASFINDASR